MYIVILQIQFDQKSLENVRVARTKQLSKAIWLLTKVLIPFLTIFLSENASFALDCIQKQVPKPHFQNIKSEFEPDVQKLMTEILRVV